MPDPQIPRPSRAFAELGVPIVAPDGRLRPAVEVWRDVERALVELPVKRRADLAEALGVADAIERALGGPVGVGGPRGPGAPRR